MQIFVFINNFFLEKMEKIVTFYAWFCAIFLVAWIPFRVFTPLFINVRHTYQLPAQECVNRLTSDLWTFESIREGLFALYILIPFTLCLMMWTKERTAWRLHLMVLVALFCWSCVNLGFDINDMAHANVSPDSNNFRPQNLARDSRWCLYYGGQPRTELLCANTQLCTGPAVDPLLFGVDKWFAVRFAMNVMLLGFIIVDFWSMWSWKNDILQPQKIRYSILKE